MPTTKQAKQQFGEGRGEEHIDMGKGREGGVNVESGEGY